MKTIKHIFDGDYGCEESRSKKPIVSVTLVDESGQESYVAIEDDWLAQHHLDVGSVWPVYLDRICEMEEILNKANYLIAYKHDEIKAFLPSIQKLESYYTSPEWKEDLARDENGELPDSLKRGVLSEDGIYDMLEKLKEQDLGIVLQ